jgi:Leucine-rich repeat (LRR) protein/sugar lactone lactonase YvrE
MNKPCRLPIQSGSLVRIINPLILSLILSLALMPEAAKAQQWQQMVSLGSISSIAVSGSNVYAATTNNGVFLSTDNGVSWASANNGLTIPGGQGVNVIAASGNYAYAGVGPTFPLINIGSVFRSTNNGTNWTLSNPPGQPQVNAIVAVDNFVSVGVGGNYGLPPTPVNPNSYNINCMYASTNNGTSWYQNFFPVAIEKLALYQNPSSGSTTVFAEGRTYWPYIYGLPDPPYFYMSSDKGQTWSSLTSSGFTYNTSITAIGVTGGTYPGQPYVGIPSGGVYYLAGSWMPANNGLTNLNIRAFAANGNKTYVGTDGGVFVSTSYGGAWTSVGLTNQSVKGLTVSGNYLWAGTGSGVFRLDINPINVPDSNFRVVLSSNYGITFDGNNNIINREAAAALASLDVSSRNITSLTGIAAFTGLTQLNCSNNQLTSLNVLANAALTTLNISGNPTPFTLYVQSLPFPPSGFAFTNTEPPATIHRSIVVPDANFRYWLSSRYGIMFDSSHRITNPETAAALARLDVSNGSIANLTGIEAFINLVYLNCSNNQLTSLNVSASTALDTVDCSYNQLTGLTIGANATLKFLDCSDNQLTGLSVSGSTALQYLYCSYNQLASLNVGGNAALTDLRCDNNQLTGLDASANTQLQFLYCFNNQLTNLNVGTNTALTNLLCGNNQLTSLDVSANSALTTLDISGNPTPFTLYVLSLPFPPDGLNFINTDPPAAIHSLFISVSDANFRAVLSSQYGITFNGNTYISNPLAAAALTRMNVSGQSIANLTGIEAFTSLVYLTCSNNQLTSLDVSANTALDTVDCSYNQLTGLMIGANVALKFLDCSDNQLTGVDVSANTSLQYLYCSYNQLANLNVSANKALTDLRCDNNQLTGLDASANTQLQFLYCFNNQLVSLTESPSPALNYFYCYSNQLTSLNVVANTALTNLLCSNNQLTSLVVPNPALTTLDISGNPTPFTLYVLSLPFPPSGLAFTNTEPSATVRRLTAVPDTNFRAVLNYNYGITFNGNSITNPLAASAMTYLDVNSQSITDLTGIEAFTGLTYLDCSNNQVTSLNVTANAALTDLQCNNNLLTGLDASANTQLQILYCYSNQLTELNVSANTVLADFQCYNNQLTSLNVSANTVLTTLYCYSNQLTSLNVSANTALTDLRCDNNLLTGLDASANTQLQILYCTYNQLTSLNVPSGSALTDLQCYNNQLTSLNVSGSNALQTLDCDHNLLAGLDVSANAALQMLYCFNNQLASLSVSANPALMYLTCNNNQLTGLDVSNNQALTTLDISGNPTPFTLFVLALPFPPSGLAFTDTDPPAGINSTASIRSADVVLGQPDFTSNAAATTQGGMNNPTSVAIDPTTGKVFVADYANNRVLRFTTVAASASGSSAEAVLGQPDFTSNAPSTTQSGMDQPIGVATDVSGNLYVADYANSRVLRFGNASTKANGADADGVLGQSDFYSNTQATTQSGMYYPYGVAADAVGNLYVSDYTNSRVLRFGNAAMKANGANADAVLGQSDYESSATVTSQNGMNYPIGVSVDGSGVLYVADTYNNRVLRFDSAATKANGADADGVLGQADFISSTPATTQSGMAYPSGVTVDALGVLYVADNQNNRVLQFTNAVTKANGANADGLLGQPNYSTNLAATWQSRMAYPYGVVVDALGNLYVADFNNNRVLRFNGTGILPVELVGITAKAVPSGVMLSWQTATEKNNAGFDVERSADKMMFSKIGFIKGNGTTTQSHSYAFTDSKVVGKVFYRLKQTDYDGKFQYSKTIEVQAGMPKAFALMQNYPNPFNPTTTIVYALPQAGQVTLKVYDVLGREVATLVNERKDAGNYETKFEANRFASGIYFYKLEARSSGSQAGNFVQTKKMLLVK